jgi:hypothetical protein
VNTANRHPLQGFPTFLTSATLLALAAWLTGCAGVSANGTWQNGASHNQTFSRVLIVGVTPNRNLRCAYESTLASQIQNASTTAISSCDQLNSKEPLTRENIERVVASVHADAVLATRLVSMATGEREGRSNDTRGNSVYKATDFGYGYYGMPVTQVEFQTAPPLSAITSSIHVVTQVYDTRSAALLYTLDTKTNAQEIDSTEATLMTIAIPTAKGLRSAGLIR